MSQNSWNIHDYSKPPPTPSSVYQQLRSELPLTNESPRKNTDQDVNSPGQNDIQQNTTCSYSRNQVPNNNRNVEFTAWREKASIEDWKAFLLSTPTNMQTPQLQRQPTQYGLNTDSIQYRIAQQHPAAYTSYSSAFNGGFRPVVGHETKRNSGAIDSRRAFMEKLRLNNAAVKDWFQARLLENRIKSEYFYPPGLLERIRLEKERLRSGIAHVENLMRNPNDRGYVLLDERAINVLVTIIDRILPKDISLEILNQQTHEV